MMLIFKHLVFLILLLSAGCNTQRHEPVESRHPISPQAESNALDIEEIVVLEAVITYLATTYRMQRLVISSETDYEEPAGGLNALPSELKKSLAGIKDETIEGFLNSRRVRKTIPGTLNVPTVLDVINKVERIRRIEEAFSQLRNGWEEFSREYPGSYGLVTFSRVGFDISRRQALIYRSTLFGIDGGGAGYVLLNKVGDKWVVAAEMTAYIG